mgnify:CR=1 FL=1
MNPFEGAPEDLTQRVTMADRFLYEMFRRPKNPYSSTERDSSLFRVFVAGVMIQALVFIACVLLLLFGKLIDVLF